MKLLLVDNLVVPDPSTLAEADLHPHLGLLALAAGAACGGHRCTVFDPKRALRDAELPADETLYEAAATRLLAERPDAIGFTTLGCSLLFAVQVATALKRHEPDLPLLLGGPHATMLDGALLERFPAFDLVARHECDETLPLLLDALPARRFEAIAGLTWRTRTGLKRTAGSPKVEDLDTLPLLDYDLYPVDRLGLPLLRIEAGRGCPYQCTFCSTAGFFQRSFRLKSAGRLVAELDRLHQRYGVRDFKLDHDMFTVNRHKVREFCEAVHGRGYRWRASARVDGVDAALLRTMADAGCVNLYFGIETGSARMQRISRKRLDLALVEPILHEAAALGIETEASFITGYPEENAADQDATLDLLGRLDSPRCRTQLHLLAPEPGTPLHAEHAHALAYDGQGGPYNALLRGAADEALVHAEPLLFSTYHHYPATLPRWRHLFVVQAADLLRRLGPLVAAYLLRAWQGRLSVLVHDWIGDAVEPEPPSAQDLLAFLAQRFGARHHAVSLARYALALHTGQACPAPAVAGGDFDAAASWHLHPGASVLSDLHDCEALLAAIHASEAHDRLLDDRRFRRRRHYVLLRGAGPACSWTVDAGAAELLSLFSQPRSGREVLDWLAAVAGDDAAPQALLSAFTRRQVLVRCGEPQAA